MEHVPKSLLSTPIDLSLHRDRNAEAEALKSITEAISQAQHPVLFVDGLVDRYSARKECRELARFLRIPVYTCNMGKSIIDETEEYFAGMYQGIISDEHITQAFEQSDCVLVLGSVNADTNSGGLTRKFKTESSIWINPRTVVVSV
jgi:pyruvate decarboxylase